MASDKTYGELLKDSRWQQMRLEVMSRDGWACRKCGASGEGVMLAVHHRYYVRGHAPWEYSIDTPLRTLCDPCHKRAEWMRGLLSESVALLDEKDEEFVLGFVQGVFAKRLNSNGRNVISNIASDLQCDGLDLGYGCAKGSSKAAVAGSAGGEIRFNHETSSPEPVV